VNSNKQKSALNVMKGIHQPSQLNDELVDKLKKKKSKNLTSKEYVDGILAGNRTILSQAITLIESSLPSHQHKAQEIIGECFKVCHSSFAIRHSPHESGQHSDEPQIRTANREQRTANSEYQASSIRIGITGVPGVGKSTFIEALGKQLTSQGHKLAVLAIDPSSSRSKGSILGDKTRMEELAVDPYAFIRPSPAAGSLGGVTRKTRETIILCETAGFDVIFVETVGVGQSETVVHSMVDFFLLLMLAGAGDELQGIKRGIIEMADTIIINKADGDNIKKAQLARMEYSNALHLFPPSESGWKPVVDVCSSKTKEGIANIWNIINDYHSFTVQNGYFRKRRMEQNRQVLYETIEEALKNHFFSGKEISDSLVKLEKEIITGKANPYTSAQHLLEKYFIPFLSSSAKADV
jgi:LAO/AO transport system kinase